MKTKLTRAMNNKVGRVTLCAPQHDDTTTARRGLTRPAIIKRAALLALLSTLHPQLSIFAQGSLTPPGTPAPTMKSLDQVEARTPISTVPILITNSGSYYLTANFTVGTGVNAIFIMTNGVTLDLNGFTLSSTGASANATGVLINDGLSDITILNGHIKSGIINIGSTFGGTGFGFGIYAVGASPVNVLVSQVTVSGVLHDGINLGIFASGAKTTAVKSCTVNVAGEVGIAATTVADSTALNCGGTAISGWAVQNCHGSSVGSGDGIDAYTAQNCSGDSSSSDGMKVFANANNCSGASSTGIGLVADTASFCTGSRLNGTAIKATVATGCHAINGTNNITFKYNMP